MTTEVRKAILTHVNYLAEWEAANFRRGPNYPSIYKAVATAWEMPLEVVKEIVRDDAAGTMGVG